MACLQYTQTLHMSYTVMADVCPIRCVYAIPVSMLYDRGTIESLRICKLSVLPVHMHAGVRAGGSCAKKCSHYLFKHLSCDIKHPQMHNSGRVEAATVDKDHRMVISVMWHAGRKLVCWKRNANCP